MRANPGRFVVYEKNDRSVCGARGYPQLSGGWQAGDVDDLRIGSIARAVRVRRRLRQCDVAAMAHVSASTVCRLERGHLESLSVATVRRVASVLDVRVDMVGRSRGGELDRLVNSRHSALHESVARHFESLREWVVRPEATFSVYGERGAIDLLCWHEARRALLVVELKTEIVDINELLGTLDRKRRLAPAAAREFGWTPASVSVWVIVSGSRTNRRRILVHRAMLANALPDDSSTVKRWLASPAGPLAALSTWSLPADDSSRRLHAPRRIRRRQASVGPRDD
jgi:transcriptional regulator with XRE-family HTH domain